MTNTTRTAPASYRRLHPAVSARLSAIRQDAQPLARGSKWAAASTGIATVDALAAEVRRSMATVSQSEGQS